MPTAKGQSFWDHLDELRTVIVRIAVAVLAGGMVAFCLKQPLFELVLAPNSPDFITYRLLDCIAQWAGTQPDAMQSISLINTGLAQQFVLHVKMALSVGALCVSPYIIYQLFQFVQPALYQHERRYAVRLVLSGYAMFVVGMAMAYLLVFPLTFRFLGTYQVSAEVDNLISLESYIGTLLGMCLALGITFEMPVLCWLLSRFGLIDAALLRRFRRHAVVAILVAAAIITPTADAFTLFAVALPMWLLYELSIAIAGKTGKKIISKKKYQ